MQHLPKNKYIHIYTWVFRFQAVFFEDYRVRTKYWTPYDTKYGLFLIVLWKNYEKISHCLGLDALFATFKPKKCEIFHNFCIKWSEKGHILYYMGGPILCTHPVNQSGQIILVELTKVQRALIAKSRKHNARMEVGREKETLTSWFVKPFELDIITVFWQCSVLCMVLEYTLCFQDPFSLSCNYVKRSLWLHLFEYHTVSNP